MPFITIEYKILQTVMFYLFIGSAESLVNHISSPRLQWAVIAKCQTECWHYLPAVFLSRWHALLPPIFPVISLRTDNVEAFWLDNNVETHRETEGMENQFVRLSISRYFSFSSWCFSGELERRAAWLTENKAKNSGSTLQYLLSQFTNVYWLGQTSPWSPALAEWHWCATYL